MIGTTSFDGFSQGSDVELDRAAPAELLHRTSGSTPSTRSRRRGRSGLLCMVGLVGRGSASAWPGCNTVGEGQHDARSSPGASCHTLVPSRWPTIVAHYFSALVYNGQMDGYLISDPAGRRSDLFGTADASINYHVISATSIWYVQVAALVAGHVCGLILAHDRAIAMYPLGARRHPARSTGCSRCIVSFTSLGRWLTTGVGRTRNDVFRRCIAHFGHLVAVAALPRAGHHRRGLGCRFQSWRDNRKSGED